MNQWNELLPAVVRDGLQHDEAESLAQLNDSIVHIRSLLGGKGDLVSNKDIGKLFRQITTHSQLKYVYTVSNWANFLPVGLLQFTHQLWDTTATEHFPGRVVDPLDGSVPVRPSVVTHENGRTGCAQEPVQARKVSRTCSHSW